MEVTLKNVTFHLCDLNKNIVDEWQTYFKSHDNFKFYNQNIFTVPVDKMNVNAIVSPANSFGDLQGGIDLVYYNYFGHQLEEQLQNKIINEYYGELIVGEAMILKLNHNLYHYFISAPTMRVPQDVSKTLNAYLAFRAVLIQIINFNNINDNKITNVICPGLATSIGKLSPEHCAKQMLFAYQAITNPHYDLDLMQESCQQYMMSDYLDT